MGRTNPTVTLKVAFLDNNADPITLDYIPEEFLPVDYILFDFTWATNDELAVVVTNRVQNKARTRRCNIEGNTCYDVSSGLNVYLLV